MVSAKVDRDKKPHAQQVQKRWNHPCRTCTLLTGLVIVLKSINKALLQ